MHALPRQLAEHGKNAATGRRADKLGTKCTRCKTGGGILAGISRTYTGRKERSLDSECMRCRASWQSTCRNYSWSHRQGLKSDVCALMNYWSDFEPPPAALRHDLSLLTDACWRCVFGRFWVLVWNFSSCGRERKNMTTSRQPCDIIIIVGSSGVTVYIRPGLHRVAAHCLTTSGQTLHTRFNTWFMTFVYVCHPPCICSHVVSHATSAVEMKGTHEGVIAPVVKIVDTFP